MRVYSVFGAPAFILTSAESIRVINTTNHCKYTKTQTTRNALGTLIGENGIILAEGEAHARLRRAIAPALHHDALIAAEKVFLREGQLLADRLAKSQSSAQMDILRDVRTATFQVVIDTAFGENAVPPDQCTRLHDAFLDAFLEPPSHTFRRAILQDILSFLPARYFGWREDLRTYIRNSVSKICRELKKSAKQHGAVTPLISLMIDEETYRVLPERDLVETILSFLAAGQATTSISVCWTLYLLARHADWQNRVLAELRDNWSVTDGLDVLDQLPLLSRVVRESLRLYPPVFYMARELKEDDELEGYRLPAETVIRTPLASVHRTKNIWGEDAAEFNPDRFAVPGELSRTRQHWLPFLYGPRGCSGQRFAILEIKAFVAQVLLRYRLYVKPLQDPPAACFGPFATPRNMKVYFEFGPST